MANCMLLILYSGIVPRKRESWPDENMALIWLTEEAGIPPVAG